MRQWQPDERCQYAGDAEFTGRDAVLEQTCSEQRQSVLRICIQNAKIPALLYPKKAFEILAEARQWVQRFVQWYNNDHQHSAIGFVTPSQRHASKDTAILKQRDEVYARAKSANPKRWSGATLNWEPLSLCI